jgi:cytochrome c oxidase subunit 1
LAIFAGIYYWFPKITGRLLNDRIGQIQFWIMLLGFNLTFFPMHILGLLGMPRRIYTYGSGLGWDTWNLLETVGAFTLAVSVLIFIWNVFTSLRNGEEAGNDPWDGHTLEWTTTSPPPAYNFETIPIVHSRRPFWDAKHQVAPQAKPGPAKAEEERAAIHMPPNSFNPIVIAIGLAVAAYGVIYLPLLAALGIAIALGGIIGWARQPV